MTPAQLKLAIKLGSYAALAVALFGAHVAYSNYYKKVGRLKCEAKAAAANEKTLPIVDIFHAAKDEARHDEDEQRETIRTEVRTGITTKRSLRTARKAGVYLTLSLATTACSSLGKTNNAPFLVASLEAAKTSKPKACDRTPQATLYPKPRAVHLRSGTDIAEQGIKYGEAYERGRDFHNDREAMHDLHWSACDKQHEAAVERWEADEAARKAALEAARKLAE